jgi:hypothetical protein
MTRFIGAAVTALVLAFAAVGLGDAHGATQPATACKAGVTTFGGAPARTFCGPAAATVRRGGSTFTIRHGQCQVVGGTFTINIGTVVLGSTSKSKPEYFGVTIFGARKDGVYRKQAVSVVHGGKSVAVASDTVVTLEDGRTRGLFRGRLFGSSTVISGSFHC